MLKFSIIIPTCGNEKMLNNCIKQIDACTRDHEIIVVSDGCDIEIPGHVKHVIQPDCLGFPKSVNNGIKEATGKIIIILNDDTLVTPDWAEHLADHLQYCDMVGPITNYCSGPQFATSFKPEKIGDLNRYSQDIYNQFKLQSEPLHRLVFFCVAIKRCVIDKVGELDERFSPGNFEDDDFCLRAISAGFVLRMALDVFIHHYGSQSFKTDKEAYSKLLETNLAKFQDKWPLSVHESLRKKCYNNNN